MNFSIARSLVILGVALGFTQAFAIHENDHFEYFDCWLEKGSALVPAEKARLKANDNSGVCGCFRVREKGGYGWRGNDEPKQILKVYDLPKPHVMDCTDGSCLKGKALEQCMDNVRQTVFSLSEFVDGHPLAGSVALVFDEDGSGWDMTPFGEYFNKRADRAKEVTCFLNVHARPDSPSKEDWKRPEVFHISGLPKKMLPETIARMNDYSDVRCLDSNELTGFAFTGYMENVRHVDEKGNLDGIETGYLNDPRTPIRQGAEWGKVAWTAQHKNGMLEGKAEFFKSNLEDGVEKPYYFKFLEVPYHQGFVDGSVKMYANDGFLLADISTKRGGLHGRTTVYNPFKKKNVTLSYTANNLEGFVDFGDFGGVFHQGLPNGMVTFWSVKDTCYEWKPGEKLCYTERVRKREWGNYKMGKFSGTMECYNGNKGGVDLDCPDPVQDSINRDPQTIAKLAHEKIEKAKLDAQKAHAAVKDAEEIVASRKHEAKRADSLVIVAEKNAKTADSLAVIDAKEKAAAEKARADSLAQAKADSLAGKTPEQKAESEKPMTPAEKKAAEKAAKLAEKKAALEAKKAKKQAAKEAAKAKKAAKKKK